MHRNAFYGYRPGQATLGSSSSAALIRTATPATVSIPSSPLCLVLSCTCLPQYSYVVTEEGERSERMHYLI